jgi:hypothetical protein
MKSIIYILSLFFTIISCHKKEDKKDFKGISNKNVSTISVYTEQFGNFQKLDSLKNLIEAKGDTTAFLELEEIYFNSEHSEEFLYYALFMSNAYNYSESYYSIYRILHTDFGKEKYKISDKLANYYLLKAYELGSKNAFNTVMERFSKRKIPTSKEYWESIVE